MCYLFENYLHNCLYNLLFRDEVEHNMVNLVSGRQIGGLLPFLSTMLYSLRDEAYAHTHTTLQSSCP